MKNILKTFQIFGIVLLASLVVAFVLVSVEQLSKRQNLRNKALTGTEVIFTTQISDTTFEKGESFHLDLYFNTQENNIVGYKTTGSITGISLDKTSLAVTNTDLVTTLNQLEGTDQDLTFNFVQMVSPSNLSGYTTNGQAVKIARITFTPDQSTTINFNISSDESQSVAFAGGYLPLELPDQAAYSLTVTTPSSSDESQDTSDDSDKDDGKKGCNENCATDTECRSEYFCFQGDCRLRDDPEDEKCGSKPDLGLHKGCNEYCANTGECDDAYICYYNRCRLEEDKTDETCTPPVSPTPSTASKGGYYITPSPSPSVSPSPSAKSVIATITVDASPTPSPRVSPSPYASPRTTITSSPSPLPTITPIPEDLDLEKKSTSPLKLILVGIGFVGIIGLIGYGIYYWRNE